MNNGSGVECSFFNYGGPATIYNNTIVKNGGTGLYLSRTQPAVITDNVIQGTGSNGYGIYVSYGSLYAEHLNIINNSQSAIFLQASGGFTLKNSTLMNNGGGINHDPSYAAGGDALIEHTIIKNNTGNGLSIRLYDSKTAIIRHNIIEMNNGSGVECSFFNYGGPAIIENNSINNCTQQGLYLSRVKNGHIKNNLISNTNYGIYFSYCSSNFIYHNNFENNIQQAYDSGKNYWNDTYPSGGNYWDDYTGLDNFSGPNQDITGSDGIGDTPYNISGGSNQDLYPLMRPWSYENQPPNPPNPIYQKTFELMEIPVGNEIIESRVLFQGRLNDPDGDKVKMQIELRKLDEYNGEFLNKYTQQSALGSSGSHVNISVAGLVKGNYHWQARTVDQYGLASNWISFGNNNNSAVDFAVNITAPPDALFSYSPISPQIGELVFFNASQSLDPDGGEISCSWNFGDGQSGLGKTITHAYSLTGSYTVMLTVTDNELKKSNYSATIQVVSNQLQDCVENFVQETKNQITEIHNHALLSASSADFFNDEVISDQKELVREMIDALLSVVFDYGLETKKVGSLSIWDYSKYHDMFPTLIDLIDTKGWIAGEVLKNILQKYAGDIVFDYVQREHKDRLLNTHYSYLGAFSHLLSTQNTQRRNTLDALKNQALTNLSKLTPQQINLFTKDIQKRQTGNLFISNLYSIKTLLPTTLQAIRQQFNQDVFLILVNELGLPTAMVVLSMIFGPWATILSIIEKYARVAYLINKMVNDAKTASIAADTLFDGFTRCDIVSRNTCQDLMNINQKSVPSTVTGKIVAVENFARGWLQKPVHYDDYHGFFPVDVYSVVTIKNTGNITATFELTGVYTKTYRYLYELPVMITEKKENIAPHQTQVITVWFKKNGDGLNMKNQIVNYYLLGINANNGVYAADMTSSKFGTTRIVTNGVVVPPEELQNAPLYSYPIQSEITKQEDNYSLCIYLENPFEFPVDINLTQCIPDSLSILSSENGTILDNNISWNMTLEPAEHKVLNNILKLQDSTIKQVNVSGAELNIYDLVHDYWIMFRSNNMSFHTNIAPVASMIYSPYPARVNQTVCFNASFSYDIDGNISSYLWDFGDSTQSSDKIAYHEYSSVGVYTVTLQVTDDKGAVSNSSKNITIKMLSPPELSEESPGNTSKGNERPPDVLSVTVSDDTDDLMTVYFRCRGHSGEWMTLQTYFFVGNGSYAFVPFGNHWIWGNTTYVWSVNVTDGTSWTNRTYSYTTKGSRYDVNNNNIVNFQDAGLVWVHRTSIAAYDGIYDVNQDGQVNFQDAGLTWIHRD